MANLQFSNILGRMIRKEGIEELGVGTVHVIDDLIDKGRSEEAKAMVEYFRTEMQVVHDIYVHYVQDLLAYIAKTYGEEQVEYAFRAALGTWFAERYEAYNKMSLEERVQLTAEGMRCHLDGPARKGDFTLTEEKERFVFQWDPCGSGGALRRSAAAAGREVESAKEAHSWTWGKKNVCLYCSHCSLVNEILPIEHFGYPNRITQYPENPGDPCTWYIYKDPDDIPEEYYERIGKTKPPRRATAQPGSASASV
ncbi:MAG: hypothetical protein JO150_16060 [Acidobacteriaceae bacterium]|nr:hypothetical protein [Acidobacteriaceae bacterium]